MSLLEPLVATGIISNLAGVLEAIDLKDQIPAANKEIGDDERRGRKIRNAAALFRDEALSARARTAHPKALKN